MDALATHKDEVTEAEDAEWDAHTDEDAPSHEEEAPGPPPTRKRSRPTREIAMENGALSFGISGSGPSVFTFTRNEDDARIINEKLQKHFLWLDTESIAYRSPINAQGPIILD